MQKLNELSGAVRSHEKTKPESMLIRNRRYVRATRSSDVAPSDRYSSHRAGPATRGSKITHKPTTIATSMDTKSLETEVGWDVPAR